MSVILRMRGRWPNIQTRLSWLSELQIPTPLTSGFQKWVWKKPEENAEAGSVCCGPFFRFPGQEEEERGISILCLILQIHLASLDKD